MVERDSLVRARNVVARELVLDFAARLAHGNHERLGSKCIRGLWYEEHMKYNTSSSSIKLIRD